MEGSGNNPEAGQDADRSRPAEDSKNRPEAGNWNERTSSRNPREERERSDTPDAKPTAGAADQWNARAAEAGSKGAGQDAADAAQRLERLERTVPEGATSIRHTKDQQQIYEVDRSTPGETVVTDLSTGKQDARIAFPDEVVEATPGRQDAVDAAQRLERLEPTVPEGATSIRHTKDQQQIYEVDRSTPGETVVTDLSTGKQDARIAFPDEVVEATPGRQDTADRAPASDVGTRSRDASREPSAVDVHGGTDRTPREEPRTGDGILDQQMTPRQFRAYVDKELAESGAAGNGPLGAMRITARLKPDDLQELRADPEGRATMVRLYREIISDLPGKEGRLQADRLLAAIEEPRTIEQREAAIAGGRMVFPARFTVLGAAHLTADLTDSGMVRVKIPQLTMGDSRFRDEIRSLPTSTFTSGLELDPGTLVGFTLYDEGEVTLYRPALYLLELSKQSSGETWKNVVNVGSAALPGGLIVRGGIFARGGLRIAEKALDAAATTLITANLAIRESRGWIIKEFGQSGRDFVEIWDRASFYAGLYGIGNAAASVALGPKLRGAWGSIESASARLSGSDKRTFERIRRSVDDYLDQAERVRLAQDRAAGAQGPEVTPRRSGADLETPAARRTESVRQAGVEVRSGEGLSLAQYRDALLADAGRSGRSARWDHAAHPRGLPESRWQPGIPIDMPNSRGNYPTYRSGIPRQRYWRERAHFELQRRRALEAGGSPDAQPSADLRLRDPVAGLSRAELEQIARTGQAPRYPNPSRPGQTWELEHFVPQRAAKDLQELGLSANEAARLTRQADPAKLMEVSPAEHAFFDAGAHSFGRRRADVADEIWEGTRAADAERSGRYLTYLSDDDVRALVQRVRGEDFSRTRGTRRLLEHLNRELAARPHLGIGNL